MELMLYLSIFLAILAVVLFWVASRSKRSSGLPGGRVIYTDTRAWGPVEKPLYDATLGLTGKPDYLVEKKGVVIPVEVKSSRIPEAPYDSHIYQLAAYCILVHRTMGKRPPYGILHYSDRSGSSRTYEVDFTPHLEAGVITILDEIRSNERQKEVGRSHQVQARCAACGYRSMCEEKLV
jgi:CRISPR-associated exonuclease Cas4